MAKEDSVEIWFVAFKTQVVTSGPAGGLRPSVGSGVEKIHLKTVAGLPFVVISDPKGYGASTSVPLDNVASIVFMADKQAIADARQKADDDMAKAKMAAIEKRKLDAEKAQAERLSFAEAKRRELAEKGPAQGV